MMSQDSMMHRPGVHGVKLMPRHLLYLILPVLIAVGGGALLTGSISRFVAANGGKGISQLQLYLAISFLAGAIAFSLSCLPKVFTWIIILFLPVFYAVLSFIVLQGKLSFIGLSLLNILFAGALWLVIKYVIFTKAIISIRTLGFAMVSGMLMYLYLLGLYFLLKQPIPQGIFMNAVLLFIFIGYGLSLANIINIRKEAELIRNHRQLEEEEDNDI